MTYQVYLDDSGGKGHTRNLVFCGLISSEEKWNSFSSDWDACLKSDPSINVFKMQHAAGLKGEFRGWSIHDRDEKLKELVAVINKYAECMFFVGFDLDAHKDTWESEMGGPMKDCYFWAFFISVLGVTYHLWEAGLRDEFEIIFDEQFIFGPRFKNYYPVLQESLKVEAPDEFKIMPSKPLFKKDDEDLPIQAADLIAWCFRRNTDNPEEKAFEWLLPHLDNLVMSNYSSYYDRERMESVMEMARKKKVPESVQEAHKKFFRK